MGMDYLESKQSDMGIKMSGQLFPSRKNGAGFFMEWGAFDLGYMEWIGLKTEFMRTRIFSIRGNLINKRLAI